MLTAKQFAKRAEVAYPTVMKWLREGIIPGANLITESPLGTYWQIPATSLDAVEKRKPGPKPKVAEEGDSRTGAEAVSRRIGRDGKIVVGSSRGATTRRRMRDAAKKLAAGNDRTQVSAVTDEAPAAKATTKKTSKKTRKGSD